MPFPKGLNVNKYPSLFSNGLVVLVILLLSRTNPAGSERLYRFPGETGGRAGKRAEGGIIGCLENMIIRTGTTALKWAYNWKMTDQYPSTEIIYFSGRPKERRILSPEQAAVLFRLPWRDERTKLANLLAAVTSLRAGEIKALQVRDIGLHLTHNFHTFMLYSLKSRTLWEGNMAQGKVSMMVKEFAGLDFHSLRLEEWFIFPRRSFGD
jgi:hypothetical protein